jgi:O-methyltransferase involved in polyketide biosynthesis
MSNPPRLPVVTAAGDMLPYLSASRRRRALDAVFEMVGGEERLAHEATKNSEGYWNFVKLWAKGPLAVTQNKTEHSVDARSVEDLWAKLDARKKEPGRVHDDSIIDITPEPDED